MSRKWQEDRGGKHSHVIPLGPSLTSDLLLAPLSLRGWFSGAHPLITGCSRLWGIVQRNLCQSLLFSVWEDNLRLGEGVGDKEVG